VTDVFETAAVHKYMFTCMYRFCAW